MMISTGESGRKTGELQERLADLSTGGTLGPRSGHPKRQGFCEFILRGQDTTRHQGG